MTGPLQHVLDAQLTGDLDTAAVRLARVHASLPQAPGDVFGGGAGDEVILGVLAEQDHPSVEASAQRGLGRQRRPEPTQHTGCGRIKTGEDAQQARLSRAARPTQDHELPRPAHKLHAAEDHLVTACDVHLLDAHALVAPVLFRDAAAEESALLHPLETDEGLQGPLTEEATPRGQREMSRSQPKPCSIATTYPLPLCEHTMHQRMIQCSHHTDGQPHPQQQLPQRRPVQLRTEPQDPQHTAQDPGRRRPERARALLKEQPPDPGGHPEQNSPGQGDLDPAGPRHGEQGGRGATADQRDA